MKDWDAEESFAPIPLKLVKLRSLKKGKQLNSISFFFIEIILLLWQKNLITAENPQSN